MNLLLVIFSFILNINDIFTKKAVEMDCIYETVSEIEYEYNNFKVLKNDYESYVYYNNELIYTQNNCYQTKYLTSDKYFIIVNKILQTGSISFIEFNMKGDLVNNKILDDFFIGDFDVILDDENYIVVGTIKESSNEVVNNKLLEKDYLKEENSIVIKFNINTEEVDYNIFGGQLNDRFSKIYLFDNNYYITGYKDTNSGYDFGYGGYNEKGYFICKLSKELILYNYAILEDEVINVEFDEFINVFLNNQIYCFNYQLNHEKGVKFDLQSIFMTMIDKNLVAFYTKNSLKIYDIKKSSFIDECNYPFNLEVNEVIHTEKYVFLKNYEDIYKVVFFDNSNENRVFNFERNELDNIENYLIALPVKLNLNQLIYEDDFNRSVFGVYDLILDYGLIKINCSVSINKRVNISNNCIYPKGINLVFSGKGYLNGNEIYNNHYINEEGEYELKLVGKDETNYYNFEVRDMLISYSEDDVKDWDYEVKVNEKLYLEIQLEYEVDDIYDVIVNNESHEFSYDKDKLQINVLFFEEIPKKYIYNINCIKYKINEEDFIREINEEIIVKVLEEDIKVKNEIYNKEDIICFESDIINNNHLLRFIKIKAVGNDEKFYFFPFKNTEIYINDNCDNYLMEVFLVYDVGGKVYEELKLFEYEFLSNNNKLCKLNVSKSENIDKLLFEIESNNIYSLSVNGNNIYTYESKNYLTPIIICLSLIIGIYVCYFLVIKKKKK